MQVHKRISRLRSYFEAVWISVRFSFMLRKMNRLQAESTENRQGIIWHILCSLMSMRGIFTYIKGYVQMMAENTEGIKMMLDGTGTAMTAAMMKQYGGVIMGTEIKGKKDYKILNSFRAQCGSGKEEHGFFCNSSIGALGTENKVSASP